MYGSKSDQEEFLTKRGDRRIRKAKGVFKRTSAMTEDVHSEGLHGEVNNMVLQRVNLKYGQKTEVPWLKSVG